jgi:hypothetical protein
MVLGFALDLLPWAMLAGIAVRIVWLRLFHVPPHLD